MCTICCQRFNKGLPKLYSPDHLRNPVLQEDGLFPQKRREAVECKAPKLLVSSLRADPDSCRTLHDLTPIRVKTAYCGVQGLRDFFLLCIKIRRNHFNTSAEEAIIRWQHFISSTWGALTFVPEMYRLQVSSQHYVQQSEAATTMHQKLPSLREKILKTYLVDLTTHLMDWFAKKQKKG